MRRIVILYLIGVLTACSVNPVTERSQLSLIPEKSVIAQSYYVYGDMIRRESSNNRLNKDDAQLARIRGIAFKIIPHAIDYKPEIIDWQWEVNLVENSDVNAYCMAGGKIVVNSGLISRLQPTDDELAQVISHEIAHALSGHQQEKMSMALAGNMIGSVVLSAATKRGASLDPDVVNALIKVALTLPYSRQLESEADSVGIKLAAMAGFDPQASPTLWQKMVALNTRLTISLLNTHPNPQDRELAMRQEAEKLTETYQRALLKAKTGTQRQIEYINGRAVGLYGPSTYSDPK